MSKECSCHGMNENCTFCSGSGYISGSKTMASAVPSYKIKPIPQKRLSPPRGVKPLGRFACTQCLAPCQSKAELDKHILEKHFVRCDFCGAPIRKEKYKQHLRQQHPPEFEEINPFVPCPHCPSPVRKDNLERHIRKMHPEHVPQDAVSSGRRAKRINRRKRGDTNHRIERDDPPEKHLPHLDGSRGFHQFRESGRFGSHPSHEDLGDEGKP